MASVSTHFTPLATLIELAYTIYVNIITMALDEAVSSTSKTQTFKK